MKVTNSELLAFADLPVGDRRLPARLSFAISVNMKEAFEKIEVYDGERIKLAEKYAKKDDEGNALIENNQYVIEDRNQWNEELRLLQETEVACNMTTVTMDDIVKCDESGFDKLTVNEISMIKFMIE